MPELSIVTIREKLYAITGYGVVTFPKLYHGNSDEWRIK
jgi:hypothetical protein